MIADQKEVNDELFDFYSNFFESNKGRPKHNIAQFLRSMEILRLTEEQSAKCEILISEEELICAFSAQK